MLKSYGVGGSQSLCGGARVYVVAHKILVSAPVSLKLIFTGFDLVGAVPWRFGFGDRA